MTPRLAAVRVLLAVLETGRSAADALPQALDALGAGDRPFCQEIVFGVLRHRRRLEAVAGRLLARPLRGRDRDIHYALLAGLYQLHYMSTAPHAAVRETVEIARAAGKPWAVRLLNATLRRFQRESAALFAAVDPDPSVRLSVPDWLAARWRADWGEAWLGIAEASNRRPPMTLRVNATRTSRADYAARLAAAGLAARPLPGLPQALMLDRPVPVTRLPGFAEGLVSVQDGAAQFAAPLLAAEPRMRVLDACAAPGGKTAHLLERTPAARVVALDSDAGRLGRIGGNLERLGLEATPVHGDGTRPGDWWDGRPFERILIDAPCSGTGVIRRHPDIKWLRRDSDIPALAARQRALLDALWPLLAIGGRLVYATCSTLSAENADVVGGFVAACEGASAVPIDIPVGDPAPVGRRIAAGDEGMDGFYYACLDKR